MGGAVDVVGEQVGDAVFILGGKAWFHDAGRRREGDGEVCMVCLLGGKIKLFSKQNIVLLNFKKFALRMEVSYVGLP